MYRDFRVGYDKSSHFKNNSERSSIYTNDCYVIKIKDNNTHLYLQNKNNFGKSGLDSIPLLHHNRYKTIKNSMHTL